MMASMVHSANILVGTVKRNVNKKLVPVFLNAPLDSTVNAVSKLVPVAVFLNATKTQVFVRDVKMASMETPVISPVLHSAYLVAILQESVSMAAQMVTMVRGVICPAPNIVYPQNVIETLETACWMGVKMGSMGRNAEQHARVNVIKINATEMVTVHKAVRNDIMVQSVKKDARGDVRDICVTRTVENVQRAATLDISPHIAIDSK